MMFDIEVNVAGASDDLPTDPPAAFTNACVFCVSRSNEVAPFPSFESICILKDYFSEMQLKSNEIYYNC